MVTSRDLDGLAGEGFRPYPVEDGDTCAECEGQTPTMWWQEGPYENRDDGTLLCERCVLKYFLGRQALYEAFTEGPRGVEKTFDPDGPNLKDLHVQNRGGLQNRLRRWGFALVAAGVPVYFFVLTLSLFMGGLSRVIGVLIFVFMIVGVILLFFGQDLADRWRRGGKIDLADPEGSWNVMMGGLALQFAGMLLGIAAIFTSLPGAELFLAFENPLALLCLGFCGAGTLAGVIGAPWDLLTPTPGDA